MQSLKNLYVQGESPNGCESFNVGYKPELNPANV